MEYLLYFSEALVPDTPEYHSDILAKARQKNEDNSITGFLHREAGYFVQYLEGDGESIDALVETIRRDPRHKNLQVLERGELVARQLPDWSMGFLTSSQLSLEDLLERTETGLDFHSVPPGEIIEMVVENADTYA